MSDEATVPEVIAEAHEGMVSLLEDLRNVAETLAARVALAESRERDLRSGLEEALRAHRKVCEEVTRMREERDEALAVAPRWVRVHTWYALCVGRAEIGTVTPYIVGADWCATCLGYQERRPDLPSAARTVCERVGIPYVEVPCE